MRKSALFQSVLLIVIVVNAVLIAGLDSIGLPLNGGELINLVSADFLGLVVILTVLPVEKEPDMRITKTDSVTLNVKHPKGDFVVRLFCVSVSNRRGFFTKMAETVKPSIFIPSLPDEFGREEVWWLHFRPNLSMDSKVKASDPEAVSKALVKAGLFQTNKMNFDPDDAYVAVFAFALSTTRHIYLAIDPPMRIDADTPDPINKGWLVRMPIAFAISSPTLSIPPRPKYLNIIGDSWESAEPKFLRHERTRKVTGGRYAGQYAHIFEIEEPKE